MEIVHFFSNPESTTHKQYEAVRAFYLEGKTAKEVAQRFGYTKATGNYSACIYAEVKFNYKYLFQ